MGARRKRRFWSDAEKRMICVQARLPGVSVSQVARRYDVNANLVFSWLRDPRFEPGEEAVEEHAGFLPVEIVDVGGEQWELSVILLGRYEGKLIIDADDIGPRAGLSVRLEPNRELLGPPVE